MSHLVAKHLEACQVVPLLVMLFGYLIKVVTTGELFLLSY